MAKTKVSVQEAGAFRRFRNSADARLIKGVLLRELALSRDEYEDTEADEKNRATVLAVKQVLQTLFDTELEKADA